MEAIEATAREARGLNDAARACWREFLAALVENAPEWQAKLAAAEEGEAKVGQQHIDALRTSTASVAAIRGTQHWLDQALRAANGGTVGDSGVRFRIPSRPQDGNAMIGIGINQYSSATVLDRFAAWLDRDDG